MKHRVQVTVSDPNHSMVSKRNEQIQKFVRISGDQSTAVARARSHFKNQGYRVHGAEHVGHVNEGAQQLLRKYMPGYAKRQIDKKMDDQKFGRTDVDKDANYYRYKKVQDKLKKEETDLAEAGPFSYGAKPPRRNSLADQIAKKRQEMQRKQPPVEPRDQMVGTAKVMRNEAAWGRDKMNNLQAAHDRHAEKAIAANRAGDHEAVKVHQSKMGMIKTQMNKLRKEEVEQVDELRTSTLLRYATKANKSLIGGDRSKEEKRIKGIQKANYKIQTRHRVKEDAELEEVRKRGLWDNIHAKRKRGEAPAKPGEEGYPKTLNIEAWSMNGRNPQRGVKVGDKVRSYDFPGMHDDHYIEGHVVADNPHTYHIRVNKVVRGGKEIPVPAHMQHVEAPKGRGSFSNAYAVHKMMAKQQSVTAAPEPMTGAQKTFSSLRKK